MNARVRRVIMMSIGGFTALAVTNVATAVAAPTTHALSLTETLNGLTQSLTQTVGALTGSSHISGSNTTANSSSNSTNSPNPTSSSTTSATTLTPATTTDTVPITEPPLEVDIQPINAMKPLGQPTTTTHPETSFSPTISQIAFRVAGLGSAVTSDPAPIQPTGQGWRIVGILWYWWVLLVAIIVVPGLIFKRVLSKFFRGLVQRTGLLTKF